METNESPRHDAVPLAQELAVALSGVHRATRRRIRRDLGLEPLSGAQIELLRLVDRSPGIGVSAAARELNLAGNSVSTLVNQLASGGYLVREVDRSDRRAARLTVTAAGTERLERWADQRTALFTEQLALLGAADRAALESALPALRRLAAGLGEPPDPREGN